MTHGYEMRGSFTAEKNPAQARFGRIFPKAATGKSWPDPAALGRRGGPMDQGTSHGQTPAPDGALGTQDNPAIPAAFTYLGQFIDHDITLDPTSSLERQNDPEATRNFRTANLELDNLYGAGPAAHPFMYDKSRPGRFLLGTLQGGDPADPAQRMDLPRNTQDVALIGDPRNDENLIVAQLHLAFLRFHNAVMDDIDIGLGDDGFLPNEGKFDRAQRLVRWHYQWLVLKHYLPTTVGPGVVEDILQNGRKLYDPNDKAEEAFIPVEFSIAAYRFGHSQVQPGYLVNPGFGAGLFPGVINAPVVPRSDLRGGPLSAREVVNWNLFIDTGLPRGGGTRFSAQINEKLVAPLLNLPLSVVPVASLPDGDPQRSLATRNLMRSAAFELPSGAEAVAEANRLGVSIPLVPPAQIWSGDLQPFASNDVPLWFYVLREAAVLADGKHLGPLGGRIVAEVLIGLLQKDPISFLVAKPDWKPLFGRSADDFDLVDLLRKAGMAGT